MCVENKVVNEKYYIKLQEYVELRKKVIIQELRHDFTRKRQTATTEVRVQ